jgi:tRNA (cmo5U34)-methyltransferase
MPIERDLVEGEPWVFDDAVADGFDEMLARSIPDHDAMRAAVAAIGLPFAEENPIVLDLGCASGAALAPFVERSWRALGFEISEPMIRAARDRFDADEGVTIVRHDLRNSFSCPGEMSVVLSVLTLMFVPTNYRQRVLRDAFTSLRPGGALILVEKVLGAGQLDDLFVAAYHEMKGGNGYSPDEIRRKQLALEGVLVPLTAEMNEGLLADAGFRPVDVFWARLNFRGWVAVRP